MTPAANSLVVPDLLTFTLGLLVYFVGVIATQRVAFLTRQTDPDILIDGVPIAIVWSEPMPGVGRPWLECPRCRRRCRPLYLRNPLACRRCHRLEFSSRYQHRTIPGYSRLLYLHRKIAAPPSRWPRPSGASVR